MALDFSLIEWEDGIEDNSAHLESHMLIMDRLNSLQDLSEKQKLIDLLIFIVLMIAIDR
jgi:hypothetical protein